LRIVAAALAGGLLLIGISTQAEDTLIDKGRYLVFAGGCLTCHTEDLDGAVPLSGGYALKSPFGTFYSPNITPDRDTGIGTWSDDDFVRAFQQGINPHGDAYFPAFPYTSYTGISREDLLAIKAYLFSLKPVKKQIPSHDLPLFMSSRLAARAWQLRYFNAARFDRDATRSDEWNRGAYLVRHLGHCGECHTPRGRLGALQYDKALTGNPDGMDGEKVPNITADQKNGIGRWSLRDIEYFLDIGMLPDGDFAGGSMSEVIDDNTSHLTHEDRMAIAIYLSSLTPAGGD
jgi:mono/diheme cytochrome c family protein